MLKSNLKESQPCRSTSELVIKLNAYPHDRHLCVVNAYSVYLERTKLLRGSESGLLIAHQKLHKKASRDTIRHWIQQIMIKAGIDINVYKPYSVKSAAASKAKAANASLVEIMQTAGWSSAATLAKFYDLEIEQGSSFADSTQPKLKLLLVKEFHVFVSCAISCFEISRDFVVRMMTRQNRKLNETYRNSMFD